MVKPLLKTEKYKCYLCGRTTPTEKHHIFGGANRRWSENYGLYVYLCHFCHNEPPIGVHFNKTVRERLQATAQRAFEDEYSHEEFIEIFGRNYL